jgi:polysaccharide deacetylase family protein (PEP-CTERM system associated)
MSRTTSTSKRSRTSSTDSVGKVTRAGLRRTRNGCWISSTNAAFRARFSSWAGWPYWHRLIYKLDRNEFAVDTRRAKDVIEQAAGEAVFGYRAPSYSITMKSLWALEVLAEAGFTYDSSIFPIRHDVYGIPDAPRQPFLVTTDAGPIVEFPITTFRMVGEQNLPVGGGGYLRILPFWYTKLGFRRAQAENLPLIAYIHPWEVDPDQPRIGGRRRSRLRHYTNLAKTDDRLRRLLALGRFSSFRGSGLADTARAVPFPSTVSTA